MAVARGEGNTSSTAYGGLEVLGDAGRARHEGHDATGHLKEHDPERPDVRLYLTQRNKNLISMNTFGTLRPIQTKKPIIFLSRLLTILSLALTNPYACLGFCGYGTANHLRYQTRHAKTIAAEPAWKAAARSPGSPAAWPPASRTSVRLINF